MNFKNFFSDSSLAGYVRAIRESPREIILNRRLLTTVALYAAGGLPLGRSLLFNMYRMML